MAPSSPINSLSSSFTSQKSRHRLPLPSFSTSKPPPTSPTDPSSSSEGLAVSHDASYVETTSRAAAEALAKWYATQQDGDGIEWAVVRVDPGEQGGEQGKVVYRIRPRSRPSTPLPLPTPTTTANRPPSPDFARSSIQPPPPTSTSALPAMGTASSLQPPLEVSTSSRSPQAPVPSRPPPASTTTSTLRYSRSIPLLQSERLAPPTFTANHTFNSSSNTSPDIPLRKSGSTPAFSIGLDAHSTGLGRSLSAGDGGPARKAGREVGGGQGDVLGRLLGWSSPPPSIAPLPDVRSTGEEVAGEKRAGRHAAARLEMIGLGFENGPGDAVKEEDEMEGSEVDPEDLPDDCASAFPTYSSNVRGEFAHFRIIDLSLPSEAVVAELYSIYSADDTSASPPPPPDTSTAAHLREATSTDSIRTARAPSPHHAPTLAPSSSTTTKKPHSSSRKRFENQAVFDAFHRPRVSEGGEATIEDDDPRFIRWEVDKSSSAGMVKSTSTSSVASAAGVQEKEHHRWSSTVSSSSSGSKGRRGTGSPAQPLDSIVNPGRGRDSTTSSISSNSIPGGGGRVIAAITVERLIAELTSKIEVELLSGTFLVYRSFVRPVDLLRLLIARFEWAMGDGGGEGMEKRVKDEEEEGFRRIVRVRTFVVLRHWVLNHFGDDFVPDKQLRRNLVEWLNRSSKDSRYREKGREKDLRLIKGLKKLCRGVKEEWLRSAMGGTEGVGRGKRGKESDEDEVDLELGADGRRIANATAGSGDVGGGVGGSPHRRRGSFAVPLALPSSPPAVSSSMALQAGLGIHELPNSAQSIVARSFTNALGTFGRFKRMLGNRIGSERDIHGGAGGSGIGGAGELEFEERGDMLWVKGGLERYLEYHNIPQGNLGADEGDRTPELDADGGDEEVDDGDEHRLQTPSQGSAEFVVVRPPSTTSQPYPGAQPVFEEPPAPESSQDLSPDTFQSSAFEEPPAQAPRAPLFTLDSSFSSPNSAYLPVRYDLLNFDGGHIFGRPQSTRLQLDDVDLSDEDEDVVEVKKSSKRLPGAHNLRMANKLRRPPPSQQHRHSHDSIASSYGEVLRPSFAGPDRESVAFVDEDDGFEHCVAVIPNFILDGIADSDEDEPGDVEAALRRLEGIVDEDKEQEKARRVERQMQRSEKLKVLKTSETATDSEAENEMDESAEERGESISTPPSSTRDSLANSVSSEQQIVAPELLQPQPHLHLQREAAVVAPASAVIDTIPSLTPAIPSKRNTRFASKRGTLGGKPSANLKNIPASLRPISARPTAGHASPTHRSFILLHKTEVLAQQFCLIERDMFRLLSWQELVGGAWQDPTARQTDVLDWETYLREERKQKLAAKESGEPGPSTVAAMIARYNLTCNWVASEVVLTFDLNERVALIAKFIRLAFKCYVQCNYQTLTQIIHGLSLPDVERLKKTWARVPLWEMRKFRGMKLFVAPDKNFKILRDATALLLSEGVPNAQPSSNGRGPPSPSGCLPFLGLFLKDLSITSELPTYFDPTSTHLPAVVDSHGSLIRVNDPTAFDHLPPLPAGVSLQPLVNLHKFRVVSGVVQQILAFQDLADEAIGWEADAGLYLKALKIRSLDPATMQECSMRLAQACRPPPAHCRR